MRRDRRQNYRKIVKIKYRIYGSSGRNDRVDRLREPLRHLARLLFHPRGIVVLGPGVGRKDQPAATRADALAQGPAFDHRLVDDREHEGRTQTQSQRTRSPLSGGRKRHQCGPCARFGAEGQHPARLQDGHGHRPGGPRRLRGRADVGQPEGDQYAAGGRRGQRRHPAHRQGPRDGARQHQAAGRRRR